ncbi:CRP/FNR family transcriptional regulator, anaerobic regulatory protein [Cohnella sp. OV330]|uniref:Crp/Fnr family transcriptional regulator n=1 Tax=Cohnella sp. OV330 TaxID=1855288 RepID=UPI0008E4B943|nr:Crp/Fnr family transcriptional regulator [Cohnella sp. OV330]SFB41443.1 CRP/FNR family transcriptional regulator, anaerobic regulatory protein [Cohnella sp. OV330]
MASFLVNHVQAGMKVGIDIFSDSGIKLLAKGTAITAQHIQMLQSHKIREIDIDGEAPVGDYRLDKARQIDPVQQANEEKAKLRQLMKHIPLFSSLAPEHIALLADRMEKREQVAQTILFRENDPGDSFFIVLSGTVKIYRTSPEGDEKILAVFNAGDSFGELSLIDGKPRSATAQTLEDAELVVMSRDHFLDMLKTHFDLNLVIMAEIVQRMRDTNDQVSDLMFFDVRTRVIKSLVKLANRFGERSDHTIVVQMPLDRHELSQMAGVKIKELNEVLYDLEDRQLVKMYASYFELNLIKLRSLLR